MPLLKKILVFLLVIAVFQTSAQKLEAVVYVTDTQGYAYEESRTATNLAAGIALSTVAIAGIIALAVQNSHNPSSSYSSAHYGHYGQCGCNDYSY